MATDGGGGFAGGVAATLDEATFRLVLSALAPSLLMAARRRSSGPTCLPQGPHSRKW